MNDLWQKEPALVTAFAGAVLGVLAAFVPSVTETQLAALNALIVALVGLVTRSQVSPAN